MSLVTVERLKLTSTRSPWWSIGAALVSCVSLAAIVVAEGSSVSMVAVLAGTQVALSLIGVMAALAVTSEYSYGTIRTTFLASPGRVGVLVAKAGAVGALAAGAGLVCGFAAWAVGRALAPAAAPLALDSEAAWRSVAGLPVVFGGAAVIAVAAALMIRRTAGAVALILLWPTTVEPLVGLIPGVGAAVQPWLPFTAAKHFLNADFGTGGGLDPWWSLGYFLLVAGVLLAAGVLVASRRDA